MPSPLGNTVSQYFVEIFGDTAGLKVDLEKGEVLATKAATNIQSKFASGFNKGADAARESLQGLGETVGSVFGRIGTSLLNPIAAVTTLGAAIGMFAISSIKDAVEFDQAFGKVRLQLLGTGEDADKLKDKLSGLTASGATAAEKVGALSLALSTGFSSEDSLKLTDTASKLARVTGVDVNQSMQLLTETLRGYGLGVESADHISNVLLTTLQKAGGADGAGQLAAGIGRIIPIANELGIPIEQVTAALVTMQQQGLAMGKGALAISTILGRVNGEAQKFRDYNIDIGKVAATEGIVGVLNALKLVSGGTIEDLRALGIEQRTLNVMLSLGGEAAGRFRDNLAGAGKLDLDDLAKKTDTYSKSMMDLKTAWEEFKLAIGGPTIPVLAKATAFAAEAIKEMTGQRTKMSAVFDDQAEELSTGLLKIHAVALGQAAAEGVVGGVRAGLVGASPEIIKKIKEIQTGVSSKPIAARAADRAQLEAESKLAQDSLKMYETAAVSHIQIDKEVAAARKASETELLGFDRKAVEEHNHYEQLRREARIRTIDMELPLFNKNVPEERHQMEALQAERVRLQLEGETAHAKHEAVLTELSAKEAAARLRIQDAEFAARKTMGDVSLQEEIDRQREIAADTTHRTDTERIAAAGQAFLLEKNMATQLYEHERAMGLKSLEDDLEFLSRKLAATKAGTAERIKAEQDVYDKEKEIEGKRNSAAMGIMGEAIERLKKRGITRGSMFDIEREKQQIGYEQSRAAIKTQYWAESGSSTANLSDIQAGYQGAARLNAENEQARRLGGTVDVLRGGAVVRGGPMTGEMGMLGFAATHPYRAKSGDSADVTQNLVESWKVSFAEVESVTDKALTGIMGRINVFGGEVRNAIEEQVARVLERTLPRIIYDQTIRDAGSTR